MRPGRPRTGCLSSGTQVVLVHLRRLWALGKDLPRTEDLAEVLSIDRATAFRAMARLRELRRLPAFSSIATPSRNFSPPIAIRPPSGSPSDSESDQNPQKPGLNPGRGGEWGGDHGWISPTGKAGVCPDGQEPTRHDPRRQDRARLGRWLTHGEGRIHADPLGLAEELAALVGHDLRRVLAFVLQARRAQRPGGWLVHVLAAGAWEPADCDLEAAGRLLRALPPASVAGIPPSPTRSASTPPMAALPGADLSYQPGIPGDAPAMDKAQVKAAYLRLMDRMRGATPSQDKDPSKMAPPVARPPAQAAGLPGLLRAESTPPTPQSLGLRLAAGMFRPVGPATENPGLALQATFAKVRGRAALPSVPSASRDPETADHVLAFLQGQGRPAYAQAPGHDLVTDALSGLTSAARARLAARSAQLEASVEAPRVVGPSTGATPCG